MAISLEANLAVLAALASLGFGWILAVLGIVSARRLESKKLAWVSIGFFLLGLQGGLFAFQVTMDPTASRGILLPALLGFAALLALYYAVYRKD